MDRGNKIQDINKCPGCGNIDIGRINKYNYYCNQCYVEVVITKKNYVYIHIFSEDGVKLSRIKVD